METHFVTIGVLLAVFALPSEAKVSYEIMSTVYLPYTYDPAPTYGFGEDASEQVAYDPQRKLVYSVGM